MQEREKWVLQGRSSYPSSLIGSDGALADPWTAGPDETWLYMKRALGRLGQKFSSLSQTAHEQVSPLWERFGHQ